MDYVKSIFNAASAYAKPAINTAKGYMPQGTTASKVIYGAAAAAAAAGVAYVARELFVKKDEQPKTEKSSLKDRAIKVVKDLISVVTEFVSKFFGKTEKKAEEPKPAESDSAVSEEKPKPVTASVIEGRYSSNGISSANQAGLDDELKKLGFEVGHHHVSVNPDQTVVDGKVIARLDSKHKGNPKIVEGVLVYSTFKGEHVLQALAKAIVDATK